MVVLLGIGFLAGVVTAISPCVLPVLPIVLAGGASGSRRRPYAIIAGLALSFAVFTLFATWLLDQLGLPQDLLRNIAIALLFLLALTIAVPQLGELVGHPFVRLGRRRAGDLGGGFLLGVSLGLVFAPCAGPVLATITVNAATLDFGWRTVALTGAYSLGAALVMLVIASGGQRASGRLKVFRTRAREVRLVFGAAIALATVGIVFNVDRDLQTRLGDYTGWIQRHTEKTSYAQGKLDEVRRLPVVSYPPSEAARGPELADFGPAPDFAGISHWLNTPRERPLSIRGLRGKVVLVDFWTYSCINCLRTLPYLEAWYRTYAKDGFVIVGVHTPEFAFEHELANVRQAVHDLGVRYPVALDNGYATWNAYYNAYWPAEYLIDATGHLRKAHFGEGRYFHTESLIRRLLAERRASLPPALKMPDRTPTGLLTPETYLGYGRLANYAGSELYANRMAPYTPPVVLRQNEIAYGGNWRVEEERIVAGRAARIVLHFHARKVHIVLGGRGRVEALLGRRKPRAVAVTEDRLYTLVSLPRIEDAVLELRFTRGVEAYAFTFG